jgi:Leucine-rich repeat (LRR) protein
LGILYAAPLEASKNENYTWLSPEFKKLGFAQGSVSLPADMIVRLDVSTGACSDLSPLSSISPDSIQILYFNVRSDPTGQFKHIGSLTGLTHLIFRSCPLTDDGILELDGLTNLEYLTCSVYQFDEKGFGITNKGLKVIAKLNKLKNLDLRSNPVSDEGLGVLEACDSLETLSLDGTQVTGKGLGNLLMLPNLRRISFGSYENGAPVDDEGMKVLGQLKQLTYLSLSGTKVTDKGMRFITGLKNLESLSLDFTEVSETGLIYLAGMDKLKSLRFQKFGDDELGDYGAECLAKVPNLERIIGKWDLTDVGFEHLAKLKKLESLDFENNVSDEHLDHIASMLGLKRLGFYRCPISDQGIEKLVALKNLESLSIRHMLTGASLKAFVKIPNLKQLTVEFEEFGPASNWQSLGEMANLETLNMGLVQFDSTACASLSRLNKLKQLSLENRNRLGSEFFDAVSGLKQLESLSIDAADASDDDYRKLLQLKKLEYLDIFSQITDEQLLSLAELPSLRIVQTNSKNITQEGIEKFKSKSKTLQSFLHPLTRK